MKKSPVQLIHVLPVILLERTDALVLVASTPDIPKY